MANIWNYLFGQRPSMKRQDVFSPEQAQAFQQMFQGLGGQGGPFGDIFGQFDPQATQNMWQQGVAQPAMRQFQQQTIPSIMQRFADQGASSGLSTSLATAGRDMNENLNAQLAQYIWQAQQQQMQQRMGGLQNFMSQQPFAFMQQPGSAGFLPNFLSAFAGGGARGFSGG
jgi:hypothetical protein